MKVVHERKKCLSCGQMFTQQRNTQKFCRVECKKNSRTPEYMKAKRECLVCGKMFSPYRPQQVYCSDKCQQGNYRVINDLPGRLRKQRAEIRGDGSD